MPFKILWSKQGRPNLADFGIEIPLLAERSDQIIAFLNQRSTNKPLLSEALQEIDAIAATDEQLLLAHSPAYVKQLSDPDAASQIVQQAYELFDSQGNPKRYHPAKATRPLVDLVAAQKLETALTCKSAQLALEHGFCYFLGGGIHHAARDQARGFCMINDVVIAIRQLQKSGKIKNAIIIDTDAHKGDGTAQITQDDPSILTLSIHMSDSWPLTEPAIQEDGRPNPAFVPSNVDIPIENKTQHQYLEKLSSGLAELGRLMPEGADLAICVNGSDPSDRDILPSTKPLQLKDSDLLARDRLVYEFLNTAAIPQLWVMAGGYGPEVYRIHAQFLAGLLSEGT